MILTEHTESGNQKNNGKLRPVIIKFVWYNDRKKAFSSKKLLKDSNVSITDSLTAFRMKKLTNARETFGFRNAWTVDGRIFYSENGSQRAKFIIKSFWLWLSYRKWEFCVLFCLLYFHIFHFWESLRGFFTRMFT